MNHEDIYHSTKKNFTEMAISGGFEYVTTITFESTKTVSNIYEWINDRENGSSDTAIYYTSYEKSMMTVAFSQERDLIQFTLKYA